MSRRIPLNKVRSGSVFTQRTRWAAAFTLIELLVVVAIIALLISILMPSLRAAKEQSRTVVCQSNIRQVVMGSLFYAQDHADQLFPASIDAGEDFPDTGGAWARLPGPNNTLLPGLLYKYLHNQNEVVECPTNLRSAGVPSDIDNMFGGNTDLDFDYTMVANTQGARLDRNIEMAFLSKPDLYGLWVLPPETTTASRLDPLPGLAIFAEEHTTFFNQDNDDGLWSNADQMTARHRGAGTMAFLDGHVIAHRPLVGPFDKKHETADQDTNDFYVRKQGTETWYRLERESGTFRPFGWVNAPGQD